MPVKFLVLSTTQDLGVHVSYGLLRIDRRGTMG